MTEETQQTGTAGLRACPFCGGSALDEGWKIVCSVCGSRNYFGPHAWNTRATDAALEQAQAERDRLAALCKANNELARMNGANRDQWRARALQYAEALEPFAEACCHLHPSQPDDGETLDGFKVADFRRAQAALAGPAGEGGGS